ncbi:hypothetical protein CPC08DRAFT_729690 [Agrocybe pediades]|nr:hypothetical protein CPC08DRAFT_729690 [Agrocybe pediades]
MAYRHAPFRPQTRQGGAILRIYKWVFFCSEHPSDPKFQGAPVYVLGAKRSIDMKVAVKRLEEHIRGCGVGANRYNIRGSDWSDCFSFEASLTGPGSLDGVLTVKLRYDWAMVETAGKWFGRKENGRTRTGSGSNQGLIYARGQCSDRLWVIPSCTGELF